VCHLQQDFKFTSIKAFCKEDKDKVAMQAKQLHEKEMMEMVRLTSTKITNSQLNNRSVVNDELNTLTVSYDLIDEPSKYFQLA
jgi:hypothetical protein